jgi:hypothetical protein
LRAESDLYEPIKAFLEGQGYVVKGEVRGCDLVALRGSEPPVIVELKRSLTLGLLIQGVNRLAMTDRVYVAVPRPSPGSRSGASPYHRDARKLCRRLGLGLITVDWDRHAARPVEIVLDPLPYRPRTSKRRAQLLLGEHERRLGDPNRGGISKRPIVTAYRQQALQCVLLLERNGPLEIAALRRLGAPAAAGRILLRNVYGWFERHGRALYGLSPSGRSALALYAEVLDLDALASQAVARSVGAPEARHKAARVVSGGAPA